MKSHLIHDKMLKFLNLPTPSKNPKIRHSCSHTVLLFSVWCFRHFYHRESPLQSPCVALQKAGAWHSCQFPESMGKNIKKKKESEKSIAYYGRLSSTPDSFTFSIFFNANQFFESVQHREH